MVGTCNSRPISDGWRGVSKMRGIFENNVPAKSEARFGGLSVTTTSLSWRIRLPPIMLLQYQSSTSIEHQNGRGATKAQSSSTQSTVEGFASFYIYRLIATPPRSRMSCTRHSASPIFSIRRRTEVENRRSPEKLASNGGTSVRSERERLWLRAGTVRLRRAATRGGVPRLQPRVLSRFGRATRVPFVAGTRDPTVKRGLFHRWFWLRSRRSQGENSISFAELDHRSCSSPLQLQSADKTRCIRDRQREMNVESQKCARV